MSNSGKLLARNINGEVNERHRAAAVAARMRMTKMVTSMSNASKRKKPKLPAVLEHRKAIMTKLCLSTKN